MRWGNSGSPLPYVLISRNSRATLGSAVRASAHCRLGLGGLYRITGQPAQAREHLATAAAMYREMDMRYWLAKVDAAAG